VYARAHTIDSRDARACRAAHHRYELTGNRFADGDDCARGDNRDGCYANRTAANDCVAKPTPNQRRDANADKPTSN
jgi:hypothetical protein